MDAKQFRTIIQEELEPVKEGIKGLRQDVGTLKTDVSTLKADLKKLDKKADLILEFTEGVDEDLQSSKKRLTRIERVPVMPMPSTSSPFYT